MVVKRMSIEKLKSEIKEIEDPRRKWGNLRHKFEDILIIRLCSIISCGEDFKDMEDFGNDREEWLRCFLELPNGIPDSDTLLAVCSLLFDGYFLAFHYQFCHQAQSTYFLEQVAPVTGRSPPQNRTCHIKVYGSPHNHSSYL
jgi:hypothetical protein